MRLTATIVASVIVIIYLSVAIHCSSLLLHCSHNP